ncbi:MAG: hypothetical protein HOO99_15415 [Hyphomicrobiaceae bacterium]|nr:hypothetical protein [Hyphomicrobiaceae bacterium]
MLRLVFKSEVAAAREGIAKLAIGRRLGEGRAIVVEASNTTAAAFRFAVGSATALAAGFLLSLGLDAMVLIGKWEILLAMVFYTGVVWALFSPVLLIPRTVGAVAESFDHAHRLAADDKVQTQNAENLAKIERLKEEHASALEDHKRRQSNRPNWTRSKNSIKEETKAADRVQSLKAELDSFGASAPSGEATNALSTGGRILRFISRLLYFTALCVAGWLMLGPIAGLALAALSAFLILLARRFGVEAVLPLATVALIVLGYSVGERFQDLPLTAIIETDREPLSARIVASTSTEIIVLTSTKNAKRRSVTLVPRSVIRKVTIDRGEDSLSSALQLLPPFPGR